MINVALIAENTTVRDSLRAAISLEPDCRWAGSWHAKEDGLKQVTQLSPEVVLIDAQLEAMSAVDCTAQIKNRLPLARIIALLVYEDPEHIFRLLQAGASAYLLKRSNPRQIMTAIRNAQSAKSAEQHQHRRNGKPAVGKSPQLRS